MSTRSTIARLVRDARQDRAWSQAQLAERARTHQTVISRLETGRFAPRLDHLDRVAAALGYEVEIRFTRARRRRRAPEASR